MIISKWVPEIAASVLMPEPLKQSLNNGLNAVLTQKSELFKNYASILFGYLTLSNIQLKLSLNTWKPETEQSPLTKGATGESMFLHGEPVQKTSLENPAALTIDDLQGNYPKTVIRLGIDEDIPWEKVHSIINSAMESHGLKVTHSNFESFKQYLTNNKIRKMDKKKNEPKQ